MPKRRPAPLETHTLDAAKEPLGRLAVKAATLLMGKHRADFLRERKHPIHVVVVNSDRLILTGKKESKKLYRRHSGYIGNLKEFSAAWMREHDSRQMIRLAILGMLPKNRLRQDLIRRLDVHRGGDKS